MRTPSSRKEAGTSACARGVVVEAAGVFSAEGAAVPAEAGTAPNARTAVKAARARALVRARSMKRSPFVVCTIRETW